MTDVFIERMVWVLFGVLLGWVIKPRQLIVKLEGCTFKPKHLWVHQVSKDAAEEEVEDGRS